MSTKRVNFNMDSECYALLKSVCALKGLSVSAYCYQLIAKDFEGLVYEDKCIRDLFMRGDYREGSNAFKLKNKVQSKFTN